MDVVIVGASVAGVSVADALRSKGHQGGITLIDAEPHLPYDKPPLSKQALDVSWEQDRGLLRPRAHYDEHRIGLRLGVAATGIESAAGSPKLVRLADGRAVSGDVIVLAPGVRARRLPESSMLPGVHCIRTADDSRAVRQSIASGPRVVVVGGGFIGAEAAGVAASQGADVTIVEAQQLPFIHLFGERVSAALARRHRAHGVRMFCGVGVDRVEGTTHVESVVLADSRRIEADLVVVGLGAVPATEWLEDSGVDLDNGIVCDEYGRTSLAGVYAAGDAASWYVPRTGLHERIEHWTTAKEQGSAVAHNILDASGSSKTTGAVPYFWSDQYGSRLQFLGTSAGHDSIHLVHGSLQTDRYVVLYGRGGVLIGALGLGATRELMAYRAHVAAGACLEDLVAAAPVEALVVFRASA